ncbi:MAG TPA: GNAT family N-acetyltransferase [Candidatus Binataceae bacterium]|nr:GNAT family N-acetyltransferase [Candidatus Binataceae bacterium]
MPLTEFRIRAAREEDAIAIAQAHVDARRVAMPWLPVIHTFEETVRFFGDFVIPHQIVLVAETEDGVMGFIAIEGAYVEHLYVAPTHQGIGIGDALLSRAMEIRPDGLMLWTFEGNHRARAFYEKRGFVAVEFTDGSRNEEQTPDVRYQLKPRRPASRA